MSSATDVFVVLKHHAHEGGYYVGVAPTMEAARRMAQDHTSEPLNWGEPDSDGVVDGDEPRTKWGVTTWYTINPARVEPSAEDPEAEGWDE